MNKIIALAILSATVAMGAASAEAATYSYQPSKTVVFEGRNAAVATDNAATAIREQVEGNARTTR
ncbi:hypothetical protein [Ancylobacter sp. TS-1]|uniref:hypothetical protein n=1 Tax=Ancylobacter sp. TS-1 TaxID=1850374 RepID=UPI001265C9E1|nr:hypothetical protein [Ancylobacter sp. TS-1]QFR33872.1 hypothetical protein GBB76_12525 [Ancylobacter sp. TS-1]